jgi:hypothetical protein
LNTSGIVTEVLDVNNFRICHGGYFRFPKFLSPDKFANSTLYYLSQTTAGDITSTKPPSGIVKPVILSLSIDSGVFFNILESSAASANTILWNSNDSGLSEAYVNPTSTLLTPSGTTIPGANAADNSVFHVLLTNAGSVFTLSNPTNAVSGQRLIFRVTQDAVGGRSLEPPSVSSKFNFGDDIPGFNISLGADSVSYISVIYNSTTDKYDVIGLSTGF